MTTYIESSGSVAQYLSDLWNRPPPWNIFNNFEYFWSKLVSIEREEPSLIIKPKKSRFHRSLTFKIMVVALDI